jgi:hypothetical protein
LFIRFFDDKHGGLPYKLGYYEWLPKKLEVEFTQDGVAIIK